MKYMGSKARFAKDILSIILTARTPKQWYVEPFAGGMNIIDKVEGNRIANDNNKYLIDMFKALVYDNWKPPLQVSEDFYKEVRANKENYPNELVAYIGFNSYGGKWFAGYRRDKEGLRDYWKEHYNNITKQIPNLNGIKFECKSYLELEIPKNSIIYCDPPYQGTTKYKDSIDYNVFWEWCRKQTKLGHTLFVSEYNAPSDFECIWKKKTKSQISDIKQKESKTSIEKLFKVK